MTCAKNLKVWLTICLFLLALGNTATSATLYVNTDGSGGAYTSIQAAIGAASSGDEIEVASGTYHEAVNFLGKAIRLYGAEGPGATTIDATGLGSSVVTCDSSEGVDTVLEGFTITGGYASIGAGMHNNPGSPTVTNCTFTLNRGSFQGGGMYNGPGSNSTVTACTFSGNSAWQHAGGMANDNSSPTVTNCTFTGNQADGLYGGGMCNYYSSPTVVNCTFANNTAGFGGGMSNYPYSSPTLTNCTFKDNSALGAGGMHNHEGCSPRLTDCIFTGNSASEDCGGMSNHSGSDAVLINCFFTGNSAGKTGGGMQNAYSHVTLTDCTFSGNTAVENGGGMQDRAGSNSSVTNCTFTANSAGLRGGGMRNDQSSPTVTDCTFSGNYAGIHGGGMYNYDGSSPTLTNCTFSNNSSVTNGGGMYSNASSPTLVNCTFTSNTGGYGGGMHNSGSSPALSNCTFMSNAAGYDGGGMYNYTGSSPTLTNCTFRNNSAANNGGAMRNQSSSPTLANCIVWGNTPDGIFVYNSAPTVTYSDVQGGWPDTGNIDLDPMFADADGRLSLGSPCIDVGDNAAVNVATDLDGNPRIVDGDLDGDSVVDMGAYETPGTLHVPDDYSTIRAAIDAAGSGYQIAVAPGTYNEAINFHGKAIRLYSSGGREVTTIDATGLGSSVVACNSGENANTVLEGFTITGGNATNGGGMFNTGSSPTVTDCIFTSNNAYRGGGMLNDQNSSPTVANCVFTCNSGDYGGGMYNAYSSHSTVTNCTFEDNTAPGYGAGGGMLNKLSDPTVTDCTFSSNTADDGGGVYNDNSSPTLTNCTFSGNYAGTRGGGMYNYDGSSPTLTNCVFTCNTGNSDGGGMYNYGGSSPTLTNCTLSGNDAGINGGGMCNVYASHSTVTNCILWGNAPDEIVDHVSNSIVTYSDVGGGWPGEGNIDLDPLFEDVDGRLLPDSPCFDKGNNAAVSGVATDLDGNPRIVDGDLDGDSVVDMGAYEYKWPNDFDADGIKDSVDMTPLFYSDSFNEGLLIGTIVDRGDQTVVVSDAPDPLGVKIKAYASGGTEQARVDWYRWDPWLGFGFRLCSIMLGAGDEANLTWVSIDIAVVKGTLEITFVADDGTEAETSLNEGNGIEFEAETCTFITPETNVDDVVLIVDGGEIILEPGESKLLANVDIDPETLNLKSEGTGVTCYIELPAGFDVGEIDVSSLLLNGQVPAELEPTEVGDYDGDGIADLMVKFDRAATHTTLEVGEVVQISVAGQLNDGTVFEDCDVVRVIEPGG